MIRPIQITGPDDRMDHRNLLAGGPGINPLPAACETCGFPNLDCVPDPYFLIRSRAQSSKEFALAEFGNLLIKHRVQKIFEVAIPGLCDFRPTFYLDSDEQTPWILAVPKRFGSTGTVSSRIKRCKACGQPASAHPGSQYDSRKIQSQFDLAKSLNWASSDRGWSEWMRRHTIFSVRLYRLLKAMKVKSLYESTGGRPQTKPTPEESAWINSQKKPLGQEMWNLKGTHLSAAELSWFHDYLKNFQSRTKSRARSKAVRWKIPPSYKQFMMKAGPQAFPNIDDTREIVTLLPPEKWRKHSPLEESDVNDDAPKNPVRFASTQFGNDFCFEMHGTGPEFPVFRYDHETNCYDAYTQNFVQALQRFTAAGN